MITGLLLSCGKGGDDEKKNNNGPSPGAPVQPPGDPAGGNPDGDPDGNPDTSGLLTLGLQLSPQAFVLPEGPAAVGAPGFALTGGITPGEPAPIPENLDENFKTSLGSGMAGSLLIAAPSSRSFLSNFFLEPFLTGGPTSIPGIITSTLEELQSLSRSVENGSMRCLTLDDDPVVVSSLRPPATETPNGFEDSDYAPSSEAIPIPESTFTCLDQSTFSDFKLAHAYGQDEDFYYMTGVKVENGEGFNAARNDFRRVAKDGTRIDVTYGIGTDGAPGSRGIFKFESKFVGENPTDEALANPANWEFEFTGTGIGVGFKCGVTLQQKNGYLYLQGADFAGMGSYESDCATALAQNATPSNVTGWARYCLTSDADFNVRDVQECLDAGLGMDDPTELAPSFSGTVDLGGLQLTPIVARRQAYADGAMKFGSDVALTFAGLPDTVQKDPLFVIKTRYMDTEGNLQIFGTIESLKQSLTTAMPQASEGAAPAACLFEEPTEHTWVFASGQDLVSLPWKTFLGCNVSREGSLQGVGVVGTDGFHYASAASQPRRTLESLSIDSSGKARGLVASGESADRAELYAFIADAESGSLEFMRVGTSDSPKTSSCGFHFKSKGALLFLRGTLQDSDCDQGRVDVDCVKTLATPDASGATMERVPLAQCLEAGLSAFELPTLVQTAPASGDVLATDFPGTPVDVYGLIEDLTAELEDTLAGVSTSEAQLELPEDRSLPSASIHCRYSEDLSPENTPLTVSYELDLNSVSALKWPALSEAIANGTVLLAYEQSGSRRTVSTQASASLVSLQIRVELVDAQGTVVAEAGPVDHPLEGGLFLSTGLFSSQAAKDAGQNLTLRVLGTGEISVECASGNNGSQAILSVGFQSVSLRF